MVSNFALTSRPLSGYPACPPVLTKVGIRLEEIERARQVKVPAHLPSKWTESSTPNCGQQLLLPVIFLTGFIGEWPGCKHGLPCSDDLKFKPKIKPGLDKVIRPITFNCFKRFREISSYRPITTSNSRFEKETVFEKLKVVTQIEIQI